MNAVAWNNSSNDVDHTAVKKTSPRDREREKGGENKIERAGGLEEIVGENVKLSTEKYVN